MGNSQGMVRRRSVPKLELGNEETRARLPQPVLGQLVAEG